MPFSARRRQVKPCDYAEVAESSDVDESSDSSQQGTTMEQRKSMPHRAARHQLKVLNNSDNSSSQDKDDSEDDSEVKQTARTARSRAKSSKSSRRAQPARAARQPPKVADTSSEQDEEMDEEEERVSDEEEGSDDEEELIPTKATRRGNSSHASMRAQPARVVRQPTKVVDTSSSEEEKDEEVNQSSRMTRTKKSTHPSRRAYPSRDSSRQLTKTDKKTTKQARPKPATKQQLKGTDSSQDSSSHSEESSEEICTVDYILASQLETRKKWREIGGSMCTSEIENGSRWHQESSSNDEGDNDLEERFLVKWKGLSYLHCSWEKNDDLIAEAINGPELISSFRKTGPPYDGSDGVFFDSSYLKIDRILETTSVRESLPLVLNEKSRNYKNGKGRRFLVKWQHLTECSNEYERDLVVNDISFESHLADLIKISKKNSSPNVSKKTRKGQTKSPAVQHSVKRCATPTSPCMDAEDSHISLSTPSREEEDEDVGYDSDIRIQKVIASRRETRQRWKEVSSKINSTEIENGSRWFQEDDDNVNNLEKLEERYLVKWAGLSFLHCSWETLADLKKIVKGASIQLRNFHTKFLDGFAYSADERGDGDYFDPSYLEIDRILKVEKDSADCGIIFDKNHRRYEQGTGRQFLIKWVNLPYTEFSYEFERDLIINEISYVEHFALLQKRLVKPSKITMSRGDTAHRRLYISMFGQSDKGYEEREAKLKEFQGTIYNTEFKNGGKLRDYQAEGVTWMLSNYIENRSMILADEMGLGKTIQTATYINYIATTVGKRGPFLIIAPLSTIPHWKREFDGWTDLNTIVYGGTAEDRRTIRQLEFAFEEDRPQNYHNGQRFLVKCHKKKCSKYLKTWMVQVVITTPEYLITDDYLELEAIDWEVLVVDEAHRLKNHATKLAVNLRNGFRFSNILCLTGTPIQNTVNELWSLLNFIDDSKFKRLESFMEQFGEMKSKETVSELHELIRPYILRRLKEDVEKSVPPKEETIIDVELTSLQKRYYRALYEKNVQYLGTNKKKTDTPSLSNLAMQLRKCCNSAFLVKGVESEFRDQMLHSKQYTTELDFLLKSSGKLVLLDKLLPKLKQEGHKVLIFSQFKIMLDIIEDYLCLTPFKFERIDGRITGLNRQNAIDRFQAKDEGGKETPLVMMLTTKAGGVGINLTAADTCIIWDSDFNPQNDLQAQARCHRIGQTKSVTVYRLLTRKTYEQQLFHMASLKMGLDTAVLHGVENKAGSGKGKTELTKEEIEKLLRHGAYDIFSEEKAGTGDEESKAFQDAKIEEIMSQRAKKVVHGNTGSNSNAAGGTFSKATFRLSLSKDPTSAAIERAQVDIDDPDFWVKMVGAERVERSTPIAAKRQRHAPNYRENGPVQDSSASASDIDSSSSSADSEAAFDDTKISKEPRRWGSSCPGEWKKTDVKAIVNLLQFFGYTDCPSSGVLSKLVLIHGENEVKGMISSIVLFTLKEAAEDEGKILEKASLKNSKISEVLDRAQGPTSKSDDPNSSEKNSPRQPSHIAGHFVEEAFQVLVMRHQLLLTCVLEDVSCWADNRSPRSVHSTLLEVNHEKKSFFSNWESLSKFLLDYAPSQLVYNRSKTMRISLNKSLLEVCSIVHIARKAVLNAEDAYKDPSTRKSDDEDLNLAMLLNIHEKNVCMPSLAWATHHDGVLVRAVAKHGWLNSPSIYNKLKSDSSLKWNVLSVEARSKHVDDGVTAEKLSQLNETAQQAIRLLLSDDDLCFDLNRVSKLLCLVKKSNTWVVNDEELRRYFNFTLPPRADLIQRAKKILGMDKEVKIDYGFTELDQSNPRNILLKEILHWLVSASVSSSSNLRNWKAAASKAELECYRLASKYSDRAMLSIAEHINTAVNNHNLRKNIRIMKNMLRAILGLELSLDFGKFDFSFLSKNRASSGSCGGQLTETSPIYNGHDKHETVMKQSWAEVAIDRCSKSSVLKSGTAKSSDTDKRLLLTLLEEQVLKILSSHGIPVWEEGWAELPDAASKNKVTWNWLANRLDFLVKLWLKQCMTKYDSAKLALQKAESTGSSEDQKKLRLQERYIAAANKVDSIQRIIPDCEALRSCPTNFGKKSVMLLQAVLNSADLKDNVLKWKKMGRAVEALGLGVVKC